MIDATHQIRSGKSGAPWMRDFDYYKVLLGGFWKSSGELQGDDLTAVRLLDGQIANTFGDHSPLVLSRWNSAVDPDSIERKNLVHKLPGKLNIK